MTVELMQSSANNSRLTAETLVIKVGGSALIYENVFESVTEQLALLYAQRCKIFVVHGGGPHLSKRLEECGVKPQFVSGLRVTDDLTLSLAIEEFSEIRDSLWQSIVAKGAKAVAVPTGSKLFECNKAAPVAFDGQLIDLGWVGDIQRVNTNQLPAEEQGIVIVPPCGADPHGNTLNINADHAAMALAAAVHADALIMLSDVPGVLKNAGEPSSRVPELDGATAAALIETGAINGGMVPKIKSCLRAIEYGVGRVSIADARVPDALLSVIQNPELAGTTIHA